MSFRTKLSAVAVGAAAVAGMFVATPAAFADDCSSQGDGGRICKAYPGSGGTISLILYAPKHPGADYTMRGWDNKHRSVHLDRERPGGGWDGPIGAGQGWTTEMYRKGLKWRACVNVGSGNYHCTQFH
ncbi:hypothetical protein [Allokutzneria albata]|uniref:Peptidase inhibitor family I36 n=1 Tax=Allokutzneria albata TaxID=211114 RepID=A0A1G9UD50_ALLAB|nr:hypothetical protein [Allokutzneria albata]SDM57881.1 hypothetical protein SAMN04489726_2344 [Allokutzneria albata]